MKDLEDIIFTHESPVPLSKDVCVELAAAELKRSQSLTHRNAQKTDDDLHGAHGDEYGPDA